MTPALDTLYIILTSMAVLRYSPRPPHLLSPVVCSRLPVYSRLLAPAGLLPPAGRMSHDILYCLLVVLLFHYGGAFVLSRAFLRRLDLA